MRNNVKVVAPAIAQGLGIIPQGIFLAINAPFHDIVLKQKEECSINLLGKGKTAIDKNQLQTVIDDFCKNEGIDKCTYEINITSKIPAHYPFYHQAAVTAGLLTALTTGYRKGHYEMELYEQYKHHFTDPTEKGAFYTSFSGGLVTGLPQDDLLQKVYTPNGLALVIIDSEGAVEDINTALSANTLLAFANTNFAKMEAFLNKYNTSHSLHELFLKHNGFGLLSINEQSKLAIFKNTMDAQGFIAELGDTNFIEASIETEGIVGM